MHFACPPSDSLVVSTNFQQHYIYKWPRDLRLVYGQLAITDNPTDSGSIEKIVEVGYELKCE